MLTRHCPTPHGDAPRHRIAYIDGLRAVAVLWPSFSAAERLILRIDVRDQLRSRSVLCYLRVLRLAIRPCESCTITERPTSNIARYAAHRLVRIVPPYYIAIALLYAASFFVPWVNHVLLYDVVRQALFLANVTSFLTGSSWTLPIDSAGIFSFRLGCIFGCATPRR